MESNVLSITFLLPDLICSESGEKSHVSSGIHRMYLVPFMKHVLPDDLFPKLFLAKDPVAGVVVQY